MAIWPFTRRGHPSDSFYTQQDRGHQGPGPRMDWSSKDADGVYQDNPYGDSFVPVSYKGDPKSLRLDAVPAAYAAINLLTEQIASLPRRVVRVQEDETKPQMMHPVTELLEFPSRILDPQQFWRMLIRAYVGYGNGFAYIRRDPHSKRPTELVPASCSAIEWRQTSRDSARQQYTIELMGSGAGGFGSGNPRSALPSSVLGFHGPGYNGLFSLSPISYAGQLILSAVRHTVKRQESSVKRGIGSSNVLKPEEGALDSYEKWKQAAANLQEQYGATDSAGKMMLLPPGVEVAQLQPITAMDLQLIELLKWGVEEIARVFGVSPVRLGHYQEGMRARTFEAQAVDFERYSVMPRVAEMDAQLTRKLLTIADQRAGLRVQTDCTSLGFGSLSERLAAADLAVARAGIWTINEARRLTGLPPRPGGDKLLEPKGAPAQDDNGGKGGQNGNNGNTGRKTGSSDR